MEEAIVDAIDTSGRAVMFAGITVCIALLGMFALGVSFLYGVAIAAAVVVSLHGPRRVDAAAGAARPHGHARAGRRGRRKLASGQRGRRCRRRSASGPAGPARCRRGPSPSRWLLWSSWARSRPRSSRCGSAPPTRAATRPEPRRMRPTSCSSRASVPATTGRCSWLPRSATQASNRRSSRRLLRSLTRPVLPLQLRRDPAGVQRREACGVRQRLPGRLAQAASTSTLLTRCAARSSLRARRDTGLKVSGRWPDGDLRRLRDRAVEQAAAVHRRRRAALVPAAGGRLPQHRDPADGGRHEHALGRRRVRRAGRRVPVGLAEDRCSASARPDRSRRSSR